MKKTLSDLIDEFLDYKKQNGYTYTSARYHINKYLDFVSIHFPNENIPNKETVKTFLNRYSDTPGSLYNITLVLREFSKYLVSLGYTYAYIIPPVKTSLPVPVLPYLFTNDEIERFFAVCDCTPYDCHVPKRHIVLPVMYRLLYCCGLRCKEVRSLRCEHVHLKKNYIDIIQSKGPKSRRIFISQELSALIMSFYKKTCQYL